MFIPGGFDGGGEGGWSYPLRKSEAKLRCAVNIKIGLNIVLEFTLEGLS